MVAPDIPDSDSTDVALGLQNMANISLEKRGSVVVSTPAYHAADRGSNPARTRRDY